MHFIKSKCDKKLREQLSDPIAHNNWGVKFSERMLGRQQMFCLSPNPSNATKKVLKRQPNIFSTAKLLTATISLTPKLHYTVKTTLDKWLQSERDLYWKGF